MSEQLQIHAAPRSEEEPVYRVGAVRRLTGIPEHTLRAWERRYDVIRPDRTEGGMRVYTEAQIARLQLVKALTDCGEAIGTIASLGDDQLRARLAAHAGRTPSAPAPSRAGRIALLEGGLAAQIEASGSDPAGFEVVARADSLEALLEALPETKPDLIVVALDALGPDVDRDLTRCHTAARGSKVVVTYTFARSSQLDRIARAGAHLVRKPIRLGRLRQRLRDLIDIDRARSVGAALRDVADPAADALKTLPRDRMFSDETLSRLTEVESSIECECPTHLAEIISRLVAFEAYSESCLSENPEDAALHARLFRATGHARSVMEELLARVCEHDGIRL